jgi:hypothetical protein
MQLETFARQGRASEERRRAEHNEHGEDNG